MLIDSGLKTRVFNKIKKVSGATHSCHLWLNRSAVAGPVQGASQAGEITCFCRDQMMNIFLNLEPGTTDYF